MALKEPRPLLRDSYALLMVSCFSLLTLRSARQVGGIISVSQVAGPVKTGEVSSRMSGTSGKHQDQGRGGPVPA